MSSSSSILSNFCRSSEKVAGSPGPGRPDRAEVRTEVRAEVVFSRSVRLSDAYLTPHKCQIINVMFKLLIIRSSSIIIIVINSF